MCRNAYRLSKRWKSSRRKRERDASLFASPRSRVDQSLTRKSRKIRLSEPADGSSYRLVRCSLEILHRSDNNDRMCGRYTLSTDLKQVAKRFGAATDEIPSIVPRYNIAPTQSVIVVSDDGKRTIKQMR